MLRRMIKSTFICSFGLVLLTACQDATTAPGRKLTIQPRFSVTANTRTPTSFTVATCSFDVVTLVGEMHMVTRSNVDENGGLHLGVHMDGRYTGVGVSGTEYTMNLVDDQSVNLTSGAHEVTFMTQQVVVSKGKNPNFDAMLLIHATFDANGTPTADKFELRQTCHG